MQLEIVVPLHKRTTRWPTLVESLEASLTEAEVDSVVLMAVCDLADRPVVAMLNDEWEGPFTRRDVALVDDAVSFASKAQAGFERRHTDTTHMLLVGDDVTFKPGWFHNLTRHIAAHPEQKLIATNDLANPRVMRGEHATHPVVDVAWVEEHGASWDGPGHLAHTGYRHCFVDDEWTMVAQRAGVFGYAAGVRVAHHHPIFDGTVADDAGVYAEGSARAVFDRDRALYIRRLEAHTNLRVVG